MLTHLVLLFILFVSKWMQHVDKSKRSFKKSSLIRVLASTFWREYLSLAIMLVVMDAVIKLSQPLVLGKLLDYFQKKTVVTRAAALWYAGALVFLNAVNAFLLHHYTMMAACYGVRVRVACCALVYRKVSVYKKRHNMTFMQRNDC